MMTVYSCYINRRDYTLLIRLFYHAPSITESRMWRELLRPAAWDTEGRLAGMSGGARVSGSSTHSSTRPNGFTADILRVQLCVGLVMTGQTEHLWRVLTDRVQKGQRVSGWSCSGTLRQDNITVQNDVTSPRVVSREHPSLRTHFETLTVSHLIIKFPVFYGT